MSWVRARALPRTQLFAAGIGIVVIALALFALSGHLFTPAGPAVYGPVQAMAPTFVAGPHGGIPSETYPSLANDNAPIPGFNFSVPRDSANGYRFFADGAKLGTAVAQIDARGDLVITGKAYKPGGGAWLAVSDRRVKEDIHPFDAGLEQVLALHPVSYEYNGMGGTEHDGRRYVGLIAQDVQRVLPYAVSYRYAKLHSGDSKESKILLYDPSSLDYVLINAVRQLSRENAELIRRVNALEAKEKAAPHASD